MGIWDDGNVLSVGCSGGYMGVFICQNPSNCLLTECILLYVSCASINLIRQQKRQAMALEKVFIRKGLSVIIYKKIPSYQKP